MIAALTAIAIFTFCTIVGLGIIAAFTSEHRPYLPLLAPVIGAASLIVPGVWLSEIGVPMAQGGPPLLVTLFVGAIVSLVFARRRLQLARYWPFVPILLVGFLLAVWPIFQFGFNWLSYSNDDMANYVLNAQRLVELGWFTVPDYSVYNFNKDPTAIYWMNWTVNNERYGAEMLITIWLSVLRVNGFQLFMPIMAALGVMQMAAAGALVYRDESRRNAALLVTALMASSALVTFGIEYQLLAQAFGLPLLVATTVMLCDFPGRFGWRSVILCSIPSAGIAMVYPEITPFLFLSVAIFYGLRLWRRAAPWHALAAWFASIGVATLLLVNLYMRNFLTVMESRLGQSAAGENTRFFIITFPFYLIPAGVPNLFGLVSAVQSPPEPWFSLVILLGFIMLALLWAACLHGTLAGEAAGPPAVVMLALGLLLFFKQNGFGLFKSAMYIQPFMIATFVLWWSNIRSRVPRSLLVVVPVALCVALNIVTQQFYVDRSRAMWSKSGTTFVEIPNASASHLLDELRRVSAAAKKPGVTFLSDSSNVVFAKVESFYARPANIIFPSDNYLPGTYMVPPDPIIQRLLIPSLVAKAIEMSTARGRHFRRPDYQFIDDYGRLAFNGFFADADVPEFERNPQNVLLLEDTGAQSVLNRWHHADSRRNLEIVPLGSVRDHLIFVAARYGLAYYSHSRTSSLFQLEPDLFYQGRTMAGMGRRFLFAVVNGDKKVRLELNYTVTLKDDGECVLHDPFVTGRTLDKHFARVIGRGSARVFLPAIAPRIMVGQPFIMLDMNINGTLFPQHRSGLMRLYGRDIPLDGRLLVGFARDISAISESDYEALRPPSFIGDLPKALLDRNLEYSGAYEDGWVSESSQYMLAHPPDATMISVRGLVPLIDGPDYHTTLRVFVAGQQVGRAELAIGTFNVRYSVRGTARRVQVKLLFSRFQRLPHGDARPIALKLFSFGFQTASEAARSSEAVTLGTQQRSDWWTGMRKAHLDFGGGWYPLETYDGQTFRWANNDATIVVHAPTTDRSRLQLDVEPGPGEGGRPGVLRLLDSSGRELGSVTLGGRQTTSFPLKTSARSETYVLHIDGGGTQIPSDPRILDFRVFSAALK